MATKAKPKNESKEIATRNTTAVSEAVPDFMKQDAGKGLGNIETSDLEIPRIQLLQSLSEQVVDGDFKPGVFFHSIAEEDLGADLKLVPLYVSKRYLLWRPRHDGGGILARSDDGVHWSPGHGKFTVKPQKGNDRTVIWETKPTVKESGLAEWGSSDPGNADSQPAATKMLCIVAYLPDYPELSPCVVTLQRGADKVGKKFLGKLTVSGAPSFGQVYKMSAIKDTNDDGDVFYNYAFEKVGMVQDEAEYTAFRDLHDRFAKDGIKIKDEEGMQSETAERDVSKDGPINI